MLGLLGGLAATETALIDEVRQLGVHELVDLLDGFLETFLGRAGNMKVKRRVLTELSAAIHRLSAVCTYGRGGHALVWVVVTAGSDI